MRNIRSEDCGNVDILKSELATLARCHGQWARRDLSPGVAAIVDKVGADVEWIAAFIAEFERSARKNNTASRVAAADRMASAWGMLRAVSVAWFAHDIQLSDIGA
jgi:hypothetical protein